MENERDAEEFKNCRYCGIVDSVYDENTLAMHEASTKHMCNRILEQFKTNRSEFTGNRHGAVVTCSASSSFSTIKNDTKAHIMISAKPNEQVKFVFRMENETNEQTMELLGIHLAHPQPQFTINDHGIEFHGDPYPLPPKTVVNKVIVTFRNAEIGHFEMPIIITFRNKSTGKNIIIVRTMVIFVEESRIPHEGGKSPYMEDTFYTKDMIQSTVSNNRDNFFSVPKTLKKLFAHSLHEADVYTHDEKRLVQETKIIIEAGPQVSNYVSFFHHLLWYEETIVRINLRKYNMSGVSLSNTGTLFELVVPGLAEKRPSLMKGDSIYVRPYKSEAVMYCGRIVEIKESTVLIQGLDQAFMNLYHPSGLFDIRFVLSRVPFERMHRAVHDITKYRDRVVPAPNPRPPKVKSVTKFFSPNVAANTEQRIAVEHILAGTSGTAPYMVYGPPGTGKTVTIVEAILQLVKLNPNNRILVCTDSNMAADHIACAIIEHETAAQVPNLLFRPNSQFRVWEVLPSRLVPYCNGHSYDTFTTVKNANLAKYHIVVCTLSHSAKFSSHQEQLRHRLQMSHLFIDEAAQASEPACLIPIAGLLRPGGHLVLAGDPMQLGPVCVSKQAAKAGLEFSLMERLDKSYKFLYNSENPDYNYISMLRNNFRSHEDIIKIPNKLFYNDKLRAHAPLDPLSEVDILDGSIKLSRAVVFHAVMSKEQREGKSPSFFNLKEIEMLQQYVKALIKKHHVNPEDIGVVTPYIRQMFKIRTWLTSQGYSKLEVGTVEAFQGKEKRVIIITTVRANCKLLDHDAKYQLGFLVDDKRFNVALTRAKAKAIIIGNPSCLSRDKKWREYIELCKEYNTYFGTEQLERTAEQLTEVAITRFGRFGITDELKAIQARQQAPSQLKKSKKKNSKKA